MSTQAGYIYERNAAWHLRYNAHEAGVRKQRSRKLCAKDDLNPSKTSQAVLKRAEDLMLKINTANAVNDAASGHNCPLCGNRCKRTLQGKFTKQGEI
jgi:hypothetical protein